MSYTNPSASSREDLKQLWVNNYVPTQDDFADLFWSFVNIKNMTTNAAPGDFGPSTSLYSLIQENKMGLLASLGSSIKYAREDHSHGTLPYVTLEPNNTYSVSGNLPVNRIAQSNFNDGEAITWDQSSNSFVAQQVRNIPASAITGEISITSIPTTAFTNVYIIDTVADLTSMSSSAALAQIGDIVIVTNVGIPNAQKQAFLLLTNPTTDSESWHEFAEHILWDKIEGTIGAGNILRNTFSVTGHTHNGDEISFTDIYNQSTSVSATLYTVQTSAHTHGSLSNLDKFTNASINGVVYPKWSDSSYLGVSSPWPSLNNNITITQNNSFSIGDLVTFNGSSYVVASSSAASASECIGIVDYASGTKFSIVMTGLFSNSSLVASLTPGTMYYLSSSGTLTNIEPTTVGYISKPVLLALSSKSGVFVNYRGIEIKS